MEVIFILHEFECGGDLDDFTGSMKSWCPNQVATTRGAIASPTKKLAAL
jgi:hypothetical protein